MTEYNIINHIIHLTRNLPINKLYDSNNVYLSQNKALLRCCYNLFSLDITYNNNILNRTHDLISGILFNNIKSGQYVCIAIPTQPHNNVIHKFVPNKDKIYIPFENLYPINYIGCIFNTFDIRIYNSDGTLDIDQKYYIVGCYLHTKYRDYFSLNRLSMKSITNYYGNYDGLFNMTNSKIYFELKSIKKIRYFINYICKNYIIYKILHKKKYFETMLELKYLPDIGIEACNAINRINMNYNILQSNI